MDIKFTFTTFLTIAIFVISLMTHLYINDINSRWNRMYSLKLESLETQAIFNSPPLCPPLVITYEARG